MFKFFLFLVLRCIPHMGGRQGEPGNVALRYSVSIKTLLLPILRRTMKTLRVACQKIVTKAKKVT